METHIRKASRIPVLRERCPNNLHLDRPSGGRRRKSTEPLRVSGEGREGRKGREGGESLWTELVKARKENEQLRNRLAEYEQMCCSVEQTIEPQSDPTHFLSPQPATLSVGCHDNEQLVELYVDNVILRSKQSLQDERLQAMVAAHSVELQSVAIQTELLASSSEAKPLYKDHTPSFMEVAINTSSAETEDSATLQKHLEAARITTELLQACLEDSQHKVATLQASEASLSREVENKEARIASLTKQMKDMITRLESTATSDCQLYLYRQLYHQSVHRCDSLRNQLDKFQRLFDKMKTIQELKDTAMDCLRRNKAILDHQHTQLQEYQVQWRQRLADSGSRQAALEKECEGLKAESNGLAEQNASLLHDCAQLLSTGAIRKAVCSLQWEAMEESVSTRENEIAKLRKKIRKYMESLKRSKDEFKENTEFSEAERATLLEVNAELETQVAALRTSLAEKQAALSAGEDALRDAEEHAREALCDRSQARQMLISTSTENGELRSATKVACSVLRAVLGACKGHTSTQDCVELDEDVPEAQLESKELCEYFTELGRNIQQTLKESQNRPGGEAIGEASLLGPPATPPHATCPLCLQRETEMGSVLTAFNSNARYGDLLRENFSLQRQVASLNHELSHGELEFHRLNTYMQEFQSRSSAKISVLKENLMRADREVAELDKLVEQVRQVLHSNIDYVRRCLPLLDLLRELDGDEAPKQY